jgi:hypothetical protein
MESFLHFVMTFAGALAAAIGILLGAIPIFLLVVWISDKMPSANKRVRNQRLGGIGFVFFGLLMLWHARWALLHHTMLFPRYPSWGKSAWMDPWQAVAVGAICFILGVVLVIDAVRKRRKRDANSSAN